MTKLYSMIILWKTAVPILKIVPQRRYSLPPSHSTIFSVELHTINKAVAPVTSIEVTLAWDAKVTSIVWAWQQFLILFYMFQLHNVWSRNMRRHLSSLCWLCFHYIKYTVCVYMYMYMYLWIDMSGQVNSMIQHDEYLLSVLTQ